MNEAIFEWTLVQIYLLDDLATFYDNTNHFPKGYTSRNSPPYAILY